ncbi:hypothetical protein [Butyrivibrio sp. VCB2006]|uniref:hypothetical protein n=1 Tax=Butyrivibrio sp. VCB2006 TaxID=1280679 RepID=UPI000400B666|nr:hypothetical protein [Butyrivibrio sp. VCB2006]
MASLDIKGLNATALTEFALSESKNASAELVKNKVSSVSDKSSDDELWAACKSFEAYFLEQMFKEMQKSVDAIKPDGGDKSTQTLVDYFKGETLQDICGSAVETQSNGFAQMLYENLKRNYDIPTAPEAAASAVETEDVEE